MSSNYFKILKLESEKVIYFIKNDILTWEEIIIVEQLSSDEIIKISKSNSHFHKNHCQNMYLEIQIYKKIDEYLHVFKLLDEISKSAVLQWSIWRMRILKNLFNKITKKQQMNFIFNKQNK